MIIKLKGLFEQILNQFKQLKFDIWKKSSPHNGKPENKLIGFIRLIVIVIEGIKINTVFSKAAALSYSTLLGLGPIIAIVIMVSGFVLKNSESDFATETLHKIISFIAPPAALEGDTEAASPEVNKELVNLVNSFVANARSGTVGLVGSLVLILISIQLIVTIETTFNIIWGVTKGRTWIQRIVIYWTLISLGAVLGFASITLLSASTIAKLFSHIPLGETFFKFSTYFAPILTFVLVIILLAAFYKFIPNTVVQLKPALIGAFIVSLLLVGNNYLSFLYVSKVISTQSLYGSVGIIPILMFGLYIFWLFILIGGQITYSIQNSSHLTNRKAWKNSSKHTYEVISLVTLSLIFRRFHHCEKPYTLSELVKTINTPSQILNHCLNWLIDLGWVFPSNSRDQSGEVSVSFQAGIPPETLSLAKFKSAYESYGNNEGVAIIEEQEPIIEYYTQKVTSYQNNPDAQTTFKDLIS